MPCFIFDLKCDFYMFLNRIKKHLQIACADGVKLERKN